jgi:hypothetical protein
MAPRWWSSRGEHIDVVMPGHPGPAFGRPECKLVPGIHVFKFVRQRRGWPGHQASEATPFFGRLCPAMTQGGGG